MYFDDLQIAMGIPLYNIKDVRTMYAVDPFAKEPIDFDEYVDKVQLIYFIQPMCSNS